ncbi:MAG: hypothetical protein NTV34_04890 [Proteobacteria bacterium]|nr:hypothetical protein [Pseudomonadota bacterium]
MMIRRRKILGAFFGLSGLLSFATVALSEGDSPIAAAEATGDPLPAQIISNGSPIRFDQDRASIVPIAGWQVEPRGSGMALVMREIVAKDPNAPIDYSQPTFARNITVLTLNQASPIDQTRAASFQEDYTKMVVRDGSLKDFQFTSSKSFAYKGESDGLVFFAQHAINGFQMMQMIVLVSSESKQYILTYTDLASHFSNPESYDAAWKVLTSIDLPGVAPQRYMREAKLGGMIGGAMMLLVLPFGFARFSSQRRIRLMVDELQKDWDNGVETPATCSRVSHLGMTRVASDVLEQSSVNCSNYPDKSAVKARGWKMNQAKKKSDLYVSDVSSFSDSVISTKKKRFDNWVVS